MRRFLKKTKQYTALLLVFTMVMSGSTAAFADSLPEFISQGTGAVSDASENMPADAYGPEAESQDAGGSAEQEATSSGADGSAEQEATSSDADSISGPETVSSDAEDAAGENTATPSGTEKATPSGTEKATPSAAEENIFSGYRSIDYTPDVSSYGKTDSSLPKFASAGLSRQGADESTLPASYSSQENGNVSSINDQDPYGTCWAFSYTEAAETEIMTAASPSTAEKYSSLGTAYYFYNIPEDPLGLVGEGTENKVQGIDEHGEDYNYLTLGGNITLTSITMSAWIGMINEDDLPWENADPTGTYAYGEYEKQAVQVGSYFIGNEETAIKQAVMQYGSVELACYATGLSGSKYSHFRTATVSNAQVTDIYAYCNSAKTSNHALQIIGWDDTVPKSAFEVDDAYHSQPSRDGAWLVRNSWGEDWPDSEADHPGCFWLSYCDKTIDNTLVAVDMEPAGTYLNNYHYDANASNLSVVTPRVGNVFRAQHTEEISAVNIGIHSTSNPYNPNGEYTLEIYISDTPFSGSPAKGIAKRTQKFRVTYSGMQFVELDEPVTVNSGQYFSVVVSTRGDAYYFIEKDGYSIWENTLYFSASVEEGESYYWNTGSNRYCDAASQRFAARIKAYTKKTAGNLNITVSDDDCAAVGEDYVIEVTEGSDYTDAEVTYTYSDTEDGEYTSVKPTTAGYWWVKATAVENDWQLGTEIRKRFQILPGYTVTWKLNNGEPDEVEYLPAGKTPTHTDPVKQSTAQYKYSFSRWNPYPAPLTGDVTYNAVYLETPQKYEVLWLDSNGNQLKRDVLEYGSVPEYGGNPPTKAPTSTYSYTFAGWSLSPDDTDPPSGQDVITPGPVTGNTVYYAKFTAAPRRYTVTWVDGTGTLETQEARYEYGEEAEYPGETPTRAATQQYVYIFAGWSLTPEISNPDPSSVEEHITVTRDITCFAKYRKELRKYTVTWKNHDGTTLETDTDVEYGTVPEYNGTTPVKNPTETRVFTFSGWDSEITAVTGDAVYTAQYTETDRHYTVRWMNGTEELAKQSDYIYRDTASYTRDDPERADPVKASTSQYEYAFAGWSLDPEDTDPPSGQGAAAPGEVMGDTVYYAKFTSSVRTYTVLWRNADGTELKSEAVAYGARPAYDAAAAPERTSAVPADTAEWKQVFTGWRDQQGTCYAGAAAKDVEITGDTVFTAYWTAQKQTYSVIWQNEDGTVLQTDEALEYGVMPAYTGTEPSKAATSSYTYTFSGWTPAVTQVTGPAVYTAVFTARSSGGSGGGSSGGGGGGGGAALTFTAAPTYSKYWYVDALNVWRIKTPAGKIITSAWLCDDAVTANGQNVWYLLNTDGTMLAAGLVQDNTGNYYSLEMNHNGYYGMLRYKNGTYDGIYMEFSQKHDGTFGAITNQSAIDALKAKYGVTRFSIGNDACVYTKTFE